MKYFTLTDVASAALSILEMASKRFSEFLTNILSAYEVVQR